MRALLEDKQFSIIISDNNLCVYLEFLRAAEGNLPRITLEQILSKVNELKICSDINKSNIQKNLQQFYANRFAPPPALMLLARGEKPVHQQIKGIQWLIESNAAHEYERVVAPDQLIAHTISQPEGVPGKDVFGQEIKSVALPDMMISEGDNVYTKKIKDKQGNEQTGYYSKYLGVVTLNNEQLSVKPLIIVSKESPFQAHIQLYGFLGDEQHTRVKVSHIMDTLKRMNITHGWNGNLLIAALCVAHWRRWSEWEKGITEKLLLLSSKKPVDADCEEVQWKVKYDSEEIKDRVVRPGQTLASFKCVSRGEAGIDVYGNEIAPKENTQRNPAAGKNVKLSKDKNLYKYTAQMLGIIKADKQISVNSLVEVSEDKLSAHINLPVFPKNGPYIPVIFSQIEITLKAEGICYGIASETLQKTLKAISSGKQSADENTCFFKTIAAHGKKPKDGIDAAIELNQKVLAGKIMKNGRINFKERSYPWNVKKGDKVGHIIPMVPEEDGINVYKQTITANKPKDIELNLDGLHKAADGHIIADKDGTLIVNKYNLTVTEILVLDGNIDNVTGNVHTDSTVIVKGHIEPGFILETSADICIDANIEKAVAKAKGNIIIRGGVRGAGSKITANGEVNVTFMEHAIVNSRASILVEESIIDCQLSAAEQVIIGEDNNPKASIVGGRTHAMQKISTGSLGNDTNIKTDIQVGYTQKEQDKYNELKKDIDHNQKELERIETLYASGAADNEDMAQLMEKLEPLGRKIDKQKKQLAVMKELMLSAVNSTVEIYNSAYPGVSITICGHKLIVDHVYKQGVFYLKGNKVQFESR